jgi:hypothetical protein
MRTVRTTTSTRTVDPGVRTGWALSIGAANWPTSRMTIGPCCSASSPTPNAVMSCGPSCARRTIFVPSPFSSMGDTAKMSTLTKPDCRKSFVIFICASSLLTSASAVFAAGNRWLCTVPSAWRPGSFDGVGGM